MMKFLSVSYSVLVKLEIKCFMELLLPMHKLIMICKIFNRFKIFKHLSFLSLQLLLESVLPVAGYSDLQARPSTGYG